MLRYKLKQNVKVLALVGVKENAQRFSLVSSAWLTHFVIFIELSALSIKYNDILTHRE